MIIRQTAFGTDFVGLFLVFAGNKLLYPERLKAKEMIEGVDSVPVKADMDMLGLFYTGNSKAVLGTDSASIKPTILNTKFTAIGNLIAANDKGAIISPLLEKNQKEIEKALGVKSAVTTIAGLNIVGSLMLVNNHGAAVHQAASEAEISIVEKTLGVDTDVGALMRSGYLGSLATVSDDTLIVAPSAIAPELAQISEILEID